MVLPDVTSHFRHMAPKRKSSKPRSRITRSKVVKAAGPHTLATCIRNFQQTRRTTDQWLVNVCQHIAVQRLTRQDVADLLEQLGGGSFEVMSKQEAWTAAGRLHRLSKDEDALRAIKFGLQSYAKRMTVTKLPF